MTGRASRPMSATRVFDRFYRRAGNSTSGSGLGLAIVKSVADAHGARVELADNPHGAGLRVSVRFPPPGAQVP